MQHEPGTLLYDPATDRFGEYQDRSGPHAMLRPVGGGREWQADPTALRPATERERLRAGVRAANARARTDGPFMLGLRRPPEPVPDCPECVELATRRAEARAAYDRSAETDADVLLRGHQRERNCPS
ncbi:hypothetical protein PYK79_38795 [Streptomyces sp. ID05-04B]|uniref:hypothetical protein n=1 Tax=unclassified Streptomyces TaxID=2593676 RepID=UPI000D1B2235|nr:MULTISPECIES: hypothetical protein [unclassified Streptomyces]AVV42709.1 hypothetical protein C6376_16030 [Streptomyces sp. P3]MDX5568035.1 hypothetical protein [Streptomyces sp. ID05-04B]